MSYFQENNAYQIWAQLSNLRCQCQTQSAKVLLMLGLVKKILSSPKNLYCGPGSSKSSRPKVLMGPWAKRSVHSNFEYHAGIFYHVPKTPKLVVLRIFRLKCPTSKVSGRGLDISWHSKLKCKTLCRFSLAFIVDCIFADMGNPTVRVGMLHCNTTLQL